MSKQQNLEDEQARWDTLHLLRRDYRVALFQGYSKAQLRPKVAILRRALVAYRSTLDRITKEAGAGE